MIDEKTPLELFNGWEDNVRQTGRTTELILSLPRDKRYAVIAWNRENADYIKEAVEKVRGKEVANNGMVLTMTNAKDNMRGYALERVYVDNSALDSLQRDYVQNMNACCSNVKEREKIYADT